MCGIIGCVGFNNAYDVIIKSLSLLEYRGYDSVGVGLFNSGKIEVFKKAGRTADLEELLKNSNFNSKCGIGHTRWATHGVVSDKNAHPFKVGRVTLVHNGIIENYKELKEEYNLSGLKSETDSEVVAALLNKFYDGNVLETITKVCSQLMGTYALLMMFDDKKDTIYATRHVSPLVFGYKDNEIMISSEVLPLTNYFDNYSILPEDCILATNDKAIAVYDKNLNKIDVNFQKINEKNVNELGEYNTYLDKEIHEQPKVLRHCLNNYVKDDLPNFGFDSLKNINKICFVACGTSYHASLMAKSTIEEYVKIPVIVEVASEFIYHEHFIDDKTLLIALSQSGETIDTIEAAKYGKSYGAKLLSLVNVENSELVHISDYHLLTLAGREMSVASTKAYTSQLLVLRLFAYYLALIKDKMSIDEVKTKIIDLYKLPSMIEEIFTKEDDINQLSKALVGKEIFMIGRANDYTSLLEAALKIKELAYINVNAYMGGEIKHGPIALIDDKTVVIGLSLDEKLNTKIVSNLKECESRKAKIILVTNDKLNTNVFDEIILIPDGKKEIEEMASIVIFQLLAKDLALLLNRDVDKPRNLAKVVTVE